MTDTVDISVKDWSGKDRRVQVKCYPCGVPGLVVHHGLKTGPITQLEAGWTITHRQSGLRVVNVCFRSRLFATAAAQRLKRAADWTKPPKAITGSAVTSAAVKALRLSIPQHELRC